eukprot:scaffold34600_cov184-Amphora_coffeaeformis.AAC.1
MWTRWNWKRSIQHYKDFNFPHTDWEDIACEDYFGMPHLPATMTRPSRHDVNHPGKPQQVPIFWTRGDKNESIQFQSQLTLSQNIEQDIMGHAVCSQPDPVPPPPFDEGFFIYQGPQGYPPEDWQDVIDLQQQFITRFPDTPSIWNEIVLQLPPRRLESVVQAVFYVINDDDDVNSDSNMELVERAQRQSRTLGDKPLLKVDLSQYYQHGGDILVCHKAEKDSVGHDTVMKNGSSFESS